MDCGHETRFDPEAVIQHFGQRGETIGGAGSVRDYVVPFRVVPLHIDSHAEGAVHVFAGRGNDNLFDRAAEMGSGLFALRKESGGFDYNLRADSLPLYAARIALREDLDRFSVNDDGIILHVNFPVKPAQDRVVF